MCSPSSCPPIAPLRVTACLGVAALLPGSLAGQGRDHCHSDRHFEHEAAIHDVTIEETVDRDGDGYASSFVIRVEADSRQQMPRQQGKRLMRAFHGVITNVVGLPIPFQRDQECVDLVPGLTFSARTADGEWVDWGYRHMQDYESYPGVADPHDRVDFYVGPFDWGDESDRTVVVFRRPDDDEPRRSFRNDGRLTSGSRTRIQALDIHVCWRPVGRRKLSGKDLAKWVGGCVDPLEELGDDVLDRAKAAVAQIAPGYQYIAQLDERFDGGLGVEIPERDRQGEEIALDARPAEQNATVTIEEPVVRTISGRVFDEGSDAGVSRARIVFDQQDGHETRSVRSSRDGGYSVDLLAGTYRVRVRQHLYHGDTTRIVVPEEGGNTTANFFLQPDRQAIDAANRIAEMTRPDVDEGRLGPNPAAGVVDAQPPDALARLAGAGDPADFSGVWDTSYGELRLHQVGRHVIGDYSDAGVMLGRVRGRCVAGVFTNGGRAGVFRFRMASGDQFEGSWAWHGQSLEGEWSGELASAEPPSRLHNFARGDGATRSTDNDRSVFDGTYGSDVGEVRLVSRDLFLLGDYGEGGIVAGMWDGDSFVGRMTDEGRTGWFDLAFLSRDGSFREGERGWLEEDGSRSWTLERMSDGTPELDNALADVSCAGDGSGG